MRLRILIVLTIMGLLFIPSVGFAEEDNYFAFRGGSDSPSPSGFDSGTHIEAAFGSTVSEGFIVEGAIGQYSSEASSSGWDATLGAWAEVDEISVTYLTATFKGTMRPSNALELYAGGGIGYYMATFDAKLATALLGFDSFTDKDSVIGYQIVAGLNYDISEKIFIGFEGKSIKADNASFTGEIYGIPLKVEGGLGGTSMLFTIGTRF